MSAKTKYRKGPIHEVEVVDDFLPSPADLAFEDDTVKVTIVLSKASIDFFKREANRHHTSYQKMIRRLLDVYARQHAEPRDTPER